MRIQGDVSIARVQLTLDFAIYEWLTDWRKRYVSIGSSAGHWAFTAGALGFHFRYQWRRS